MSKENFSPLLAPEPSKSVATGTALFTPDFAYQPAGDQPQAIEKLTQWVNDGARDSVLLGVTGSGKTFTMANVIANTGKPALILAHNKTLAGQLYEEFKAFFPHNAVEYFVSYYDYYQPEAYVPRTDTYIEKTSDVNEQIDRMRHSATRALLERRDVIVVASVSCIYGIGDPESYSQMVLPMAVGDTIEREDILKELVALQYERNDIVLERGGFRTKGEVIEVFPSHLEDEAWRVTLFGDEVESIAAFDPLTGEILGKPTQVTVYASSHYVTPKPALYTAMKTIKTELNQRLEEFTREGKLLEEQRLRERTMFDLEMLHASGFCKGIENYSRHLTGRAPGEPPPTLFDYLPDDALLFVDESHVTVSQIGGMSKGDAVRKATLSTYGFRLPSALDNRPLSFEEWDVRRPQTIYVSATPGKRELVLAGNGNAETPRIAEQVVRPTFLIDPVVEIKPVTGQVDDLFLEIGKTIALGDRVLVTTLTKKMAEQLTAYLSEHGIRVRYLHSDIETLERAEIIRDLRLGVFDVLVGINLLREGLDLPEVSLVAILDADKEGFLRSATSLIQTVGRAARSVRGRAILYADSITGSMQTMLDECARRREKQMAYNTEHNVTPQQIVREVREGIAGMSKESAEQQERQAVGSMKKLGITDLPKEMEAVRRMMFKAAEDLDFEKAAALRDRLRELEEIQMKLGGSDTVA